MWAQIKALRKGKGDGCTASQSTAETCSVAGVYAIAYTLMENFTVHDILGLAAGCMNEEAPGMTDSRAGYI